MVRRHGEHGSKSRRYLAGLLYEIVDRPSTDRIISWSQNGKSFIVWDEEAFCKDFIHKFHQTKFHFFAYRLKTAGFRKVDSEHLEYAHDAFVRGKPELAAEMDKRRMEYYATNLKTFMATAPAPPAELRKAFMEKREKAKALAKDLNQLTL